jgi:hypothetical protein
MIWVTPPQHVTIDIETIAGDPTEAEASLRRTFAPNANWKPATIGERYLEALEKKKERLALLDTAPIISVALRTEADCRLLHWLPIDDQEIGGVPLERLADQRALLWRLREYLLGCVQETVLVGHNLRHFDLPRLRLAMIRYGLRLPPCLADPEQPTYDTMAMWRYFSLEEKTMTSLEEALEAAGLVNHKAAMSGVDVPEVYRKGDYKTLAAYAIADVLAQDALYLWMTGQLPDREVESPALQPVESQQQAVEVPVVQAEIVSTSVVDEYDKLLRELGVLKGEQS